MSIVAERTVRDYTFGTVVVSCSTVSEPAQSLSPEQRVRQDDALAQVERLLASPVFKGSKRCSLFLRYVATLAFRENTGPLKERILGVEIFGRPPGYDTNDDPVVRNTAGEVRKRLAQYYQIAEHQGEMRVDIPVGSYLPQFAPASPAQPAAISSRARRWAAYRWRVLALTAVAVASAVVWFWPQSALDAFWEPVLRTSGPVLVCIGQPTAFNFAAPLQAKLDPVPMSWYAEHANDTFSMRDIRPFPTRYVTLLDAIAMSRIAMLLSSKSKPFHLRGSGSTSFSDLRDSTTVLIGAFTNDWTPKVGADARYHFQQVPATGEEGIWDRRDPKRKWTMIRPWPEWNVSEDYALVSRLLAQDTGRALITVAGITQFGTAAAGEFITNPALLQEAFRNAPRGWKKKNVQVVLSTRTVEQVAGPPRVLATYFW